MIFVVRNWKKKLIVLGLAVVLVTVLSASLPQIIQKFNGSNPVINTWFKDDEIPSGNPMRVENEKNKFDQVLDHFVVRLQEYYYKE